LLLTTNITIAGNAKIIPKKKKLNEVYTISPYDLKLILWKAIKQHTQMSEYDSIIIAIIELYKRLFLRLANFEFIQVALFKQR
jgi:hypothetical protein